MSAVGPWVIHPRVAGRRYFSPVKEIFFFARGDFTSSFLYRTGSVRRRLQNCDPTRASRQQHRRRRAAERQRRAQRIDSFAHPNCTISPHYDSLIAKIIAHGADRRETIARMRRTLDRMVVEGINTSLPLHLRILDDPDFQAGRTTTSFMDRFASRPDASVLAATA
jgi:biotin carboxylase